MIFSNSVVVYGSGDLSRSFIKRNSNIKILAVIDRKEGEGSSIGNFVVKGDNYLNEINECFDLVIASGFFMQIYERLKEEGKINNRHINKIYVLNFYKNLPPYSSDAFIDARQWKWLEDHFKDDYSREVIKLIRENRGVEKADECFEIHEFMKYAACDDYWNRVNGINRKKKVVVLDCGAYIGDTIMPLIEAINRPVSAYYAFEPMYENFIKLEEYNTIEEVDKFYPINKAVGRRNGIAEIAYDDGKLYAPSMIKEVDRKQKAEIPVISIDSLNLDDDADYYLKMDIEGIELEALRGAEKLIQSKRPNLAICLYHKTNDIFEIPQYIDSLNLDYSFYLSGGYHTIMIAVPD